MSTYQIHVFISHSWAYCQHYETLQSWIFQNNWNAGQAALIFRDYSVPKNNPIHNAPTDKLLQEAIYKQIAMSHVVVIPTGMYSHHSKWIGKEITGAQFYKKPILAVDPWGQQRTASIVGNAASDRCGWNKEGIISKIWNLYRDH